MVGDGVAFGVTGSDQDEYAPHPAPLSALTRKEYGVPFVRPVTTHW